MDVLFSVAKSAMAKDMDLLQFFKVIHFSKPPKWSGFFSKIAIRIERPTKENNSALHKFSVST